MKKWINICVVLSLGIAVVSFAALNRTEHSRDTDPTGRYTAVYSYRTYLSFLPMSPGSSSDKPCFVRILDAKGENLGEIPVPMIQMAGVVWTTNGAEVRNIGEWDFVKKTCYYWSEDQNTQIYVRR